MSSPQVEPFSRSRSRSPSRTSSADEQPRKVARKERKKYSCEECRRLKLKCDREFPCQNCIKRGCRGICPRGVRATVRVPRKSAQPSARERELERLLAENGIRIPAPRERALEEDSGEKAAQSPASGSTRSTLPPERAPHKGVDTAPAGVALLSEERTAAVADPALDMRPSSAQNVEADIPASDLTLSEASLTAALPLLEADSVARAQVPVADTQLQPPAEAAFLFDDGQDDVHSSGTLVITAAGRSKYLGPRAGNEWLKDQEIDEPDEAVPVTRTQSPVPAANNLTPLTSLSLGPLDSLCSLATSTQQSELDKASKTFPFSSSPGKGPSISSLLRRLPPESQGRALLDSYFRYFEWSYNIVPRAKLIALFDRMYAYPSKAPGDMTPDGAVLFVHQLALVFTVLAMGAVHHLELQPDDPIAEEFLSAARACLSKGNFLVINTVPGVQCLHLLAHGNLETERGKNGDTAWPLWGLAMRMIQAMGIHRDGLRWNLPPEDTEERRLVFWNMQAADVFQANCFSRPNSIQTRYCDVQFPHDETLVETNGEERGFHTIKYQIAQMSAEILDQTLDLKSPTMLAVMSLHTRITEFEENLPYRLRCRTSLLALPSVYSSAEEAVRASPDTDRWDLQLTFRQFFLSLLISEALINLHRPYFVKALKSGSDPVKSPWGASFLVVIERSNVLIQLACGLHAIHPHVSARHWFLWYHAFNSAVTLGTVVLADPRSDLAPFCMAQLDQIIGVYTTLVLGRASPRMSQNLRWLMRLRQRAMDRLDKAPPAGSERDARAEGDEDAELLGWRTRLIERTAKGVRRATTIVPSASGSAANTVSPAGLGLTTPSPNTRLDQHITTAMDQILAGPSTHVPIQTMEAGRGEVYASTEQMLHNFWDPTTILGVTGEGGSSLGWWDIELPISPTAPEGVGT